MGEVGRIGSVLSCGNTVRDTHIPHSVNLSLVHVERVPAGWKFTGGSNDVSEVDVGVGELSAEKTIHIRIVARDLEVSPEHLDGVIVAGINGAQGLLRGENNIDDNIGVGISKGLALVDDGEDVQVPDSGAIEIVGVVEFDGREDTGRGELSIHDIVEGVTSKLFSSEVNVGSLENIGETNIDPSLARGNISHLSLEEIKNSLVVPKTTLEEKTLGKATHPVLVELGVGRVLPESFHTGSSFSLGSSSVVGEDDSVDGTTGDTADSLVAHLSVNGGETREDTGLVHG